MIFKDCGNPALYMAGDGAGDKWVDSKRFGSLLHICEFS